MISLFHTFPWASPKYETRILFPWLFPCQRSPPRSALHAFAQGDQGAKTACMVGHSWCTNHSPSNTSCSTTYLLPRSKLKAGPPPNPHGCQWWRWCSRPTHATRMTRSNQFSAETSATLWIQPTQPPCPWMIWRKGEDLVGQRKRLKYPPATTNADPLPNMWS